MQPLYSRLGTGAAALALPTHGKRARNLSSLYLAFVRSAIRLCVSFSRSAAVSAWRAAAPPRGSDNRTLRRLPDFECWAQATGFQPDRRLVTHPTPWISHLGSINAASSSRPVN